MAKEYMQKRIDPKIETKILPPEEGFKRLPVPPAPVNEQIGGEYKGKTRIWSKVRPHKKAKSLVSKEPSVPPPPEPKMAKGPGYDDPKGYTNKPGPKGYTIVGRGK